MSCRIDPQSYRAFEERHSWSHNRSSRSSEFAFYVRNLPTAKLERAVYFSRNEPIADEQQPTNAVLIVLLTELSRHLIRSRTNPFRVRRDRSRSAKAFDTYYVPRIEYELHFSALSVWLRRHLALPAVLRNGQALHPATLALIDTAVSAAKLQAKPLAHSREEYDWLSDDQLVCNTIAERMRSWIAHPENAMRTKAWEARLDKDKADFLARWTPAAEASPQQLLRFDLFYAGQAGADRGFGTIPADVVKNNVRRLREALESSPNFRGHLVEFYPYSDFSVTWIIPGVILVPVSAVSAWNLLDEVKACWQKIAGPCEVQLQASFTTMEGESRYVTDDQRMLDPLWLQISRAATYLFDTRLIFDSSLSCFGSEDGKRNQPPEQNINIEE